MPWSRCAPMASTPGPRRGPRILWEEAAGSTRSRTRNGTCATRLRFRSVDEAIRLHEFWGLLTRDFEQALFQGIAHGADVFDLHHLFERIHAGQFRALDHHGVGGANRRNGDADARDWQVAELRHLARGQREMKRIEYLRQRRFVLDGDVEHEVVENEALQLFDGSGFRIHQFL